MTDIRISYSDEPFRSRLPKLSVGTQTFFIGSLDHPLGFGSYHLGSLDQALRKVW